MLIFLLYRVFLALVLFLFFFFFFRSPTEAPPVSSHQAALSATCLFWAPGLSHLRTPQEQTPRGYSRP